MLKHLNKTLVPLVKVIALVAMNFVVVTSNATPVQPVASSKANELFDMIAIESRQDWYTKETKTTIKIEESPEKSVHLIKLLESSSAIPSLIVIGYDRNSDLAELVKRSWVTTKALKKNQTMTVRIYRGETYSNAWVFSAAIWIIGPGGVPVQQGNSENSEWQIIVSMKPIKFEDQIKKSAVMLPACVGTLVSRRIIVTAGHCGDGTNRTVEIWNHDHTIKMTGHYEQHPQYQHDFYKDITNFTSTVNDIAIVRLDEDAPLSQELQIAELAPANSLTVKREVLMVGRRKIDFLKAYQGTVRNFEDRPGQNRAVIDVRLGGPCATDSGGPAYVVSDRPQLAGVLSYQTEGYCAFANAGVTLISPYLSWLEQEIKKP
ncbi:MAG: trypsin-like serine protease [Bdellovibrionota bacterium]